MPNELQDETDTRIGRQWYVATMNDGVVSGPHPTKRAAMGFHHIERCHRLPEPGVYQSCPLYPDSARITTYYIGKGTDLQNEGWNINA